MEEVVHAVDNKVSNNDLRHFSQQINDVAIGAAATTWVAQNEREIDHTRAGISDDQARFIRPETATRTPPNGKPAPQTPAPQL